ncbi:MAG: AAA family ATPase [Pleurocapsa sp.]
MNDMLSDYQILKKIDITDRHIIYRGVRKSDSLPVIIKTLNNDYPDLEAISTLKDEYKLLKNIDTSGIVCPYELRTFGNNLALILEDFAGESLERFLVVKKLSLLEFLNIGIQLAQALEEIHHHQIIHQDIKPSNIIIHPQTLVAKITDFEIATNFQKTTNQAKKEEYILSLTGTLAYISPEQTGRMNRLVDYRTDFYSLGVTFYKMLLNQLPFNSSDVLELIHYHIAQIPTPPHQINPEIPEMVSAIVQKLLHKNPEDRYQSAYGLKSDLKICLEQLKNTGEIKPFTLAKLDDYNKFQISQKLYGRSSDINNLILSFEKVASGATKMVLVSGESGVGKTALINEVRQLIIEKRGNFIAGKFEQFKRNIPYGALIQALKTLVEQILTRSSESIKIWQEKILFQVGNNGKVIIDVIPEVELIIGSQPAPPELKPKEAANRFNLVFKNFISVFLAAEHPLVLFLDDLHWADSASLKLLELLITNPDYQHLLVIGAYRNNEVDTTHPLIEILENIRKTNSIDEIILQPLKFNDIGHLLADTFDCQLESVLPLAELLFSRTQGNPFFVNQLLQTLYCDRLIIFNFKNLRWQWNLEQIKAAKIANKNIVELTIANLKKLSPESQKILQLAACIGNEFTLDFLATVHQKSQLNTMKNLWETIEAGIITPVNERSKNATICNIQDNKPFCDRTADCEAYISGDRTLLAKVADNCPKILYKFLHDRLQQAAYALIPQRKKRQIHLKIGQLLLQQIPASKIEENIFDLIDHLNIAQKLLVNSLEIHRLAKLNLIAGQKAKAAMAYQVAIRYFRIGRSILPQSSWQTHYNFVLDLYIQAAEAEYLQGNFLAAEKIVNIVLQQGKTLLDKIKVYQIQIHIYIANNQMYSAIDTGIKVLNLLGINLPESPEEINKLRSNLNLHENNIESLQKLPEITNPVIIAALDIIEIIIPPIYIVKPQSFPSVILKLIDLCLEHGTSQHSAFAYVLYGLLLCTSGEIQSGYKFGKLASNILDSSEKIAIRPKVTFLINNTIRPWQEPASSILQSFQAEIQKAIEMGDLEHACFHAKYYCTYLFFTGETLRDAADKSEKYLEMMLKFKQNFQFNYASLWTQVNLNLQGKAQNKLLLVGEKFNELETLPLWIEINNATALFAFYLAKLIICYLFKEYETALGIAKLASQYSSSAIGTICFAIHNFYYSLVLLAVYPTKSEKEQQEYLEQVTSHQQQMEVWATHAPANYLHKYLLVEAEKARVLGQNELAAEYYDRAIETATEAGYIQEAALAEELTAEFYYAQGRNKIAKLYFSDAYYHYKCWQAVEKTRDLKSRYPQFLSHQITDLNGSHNTQKTKEEQLAKLDLLSLIKASQTISSEIILDNLLAKFMEVVIENAGAERAVLLLQRDRNLIVAAEVRVSPERNIALPYVEITKYSDLPVSIINYTKTTKQPVILNQASTQGIFTNESYIIQKQAKSILSFPLFVKEELQGILYLENNLIAEIFTSQRLSILKVLIAQVSISIENARLYKNLENHASVKKSLQEKEVLLKEIHHRVKNNLFVVSNLLEMQASYLEDPEVIKIFENSQSRINSMALVHQHLYGNSKLDRIDFNKYISALTDSLYYSQGLEEREIELILDVDPIELNVETANPCGLIINELVSNSIEHGFGDRDQGKIWVCLKQNQTEEIVLTIKDNGVGFPEGKDLQNSDSLGLELVCTLTEQLDGTIELDCTNGTTIAIVFSELNYHSRI